MDMKISVKSDGSIDATNAYTVTVTGYLSETITRDVHTDSHGNGLWIDGQQREGTCQFSVGKNPRESIRRYFARMYR